MDKLIISRLQEKNNREIIRAIFDYYKVPEELKKAFWRAYNAAHREGMNIA